MRSSLPSSVRKLLAEVRYAQHTLGWRAFLRRAARKGTEFARNPAAFRAKWRDIAERSGGPELYRVISAEPVPANPALDVADRTVNWIIPDISPGSGGHVNIFRFVRALERNGYHCRIYIDGPTQFSNDRDATRALREHFLPVNAGVVVGSGSMAPAAFTFATTWRTAYTLNAFGATRQKCYFVQDFEPYFYGRGSEYSFAENTYRLGFHGVTAGEWLAAKLRHEYGMETFPVHFSYDKSLYRRTPELPKQNRPPRVFFYARPYTPRRGFDVGMLALREVARRHPEAEIVLAGWDLAGYDVPFPHQDLGALSHEELPELFHSCDIALVLSYSNASLLPLELMACGCALVSNRGEHLEWLLNERNAVLADDDFRSIGQAISDLIEDPAARLRLQRSALEFCRSTDWDREGDRLAEHLATLQERSLARSS